MSAIHIPPHPCESQSDAEALQELARVLSHTLERVSWLTWHQSDPPGLPAVEDAAAFLAKARALVRTFEEGQQKSLSHDEVLSLIHDGVPWIAGARSCQAELENQATMLVVEGGAS